MRTQKTTLILILVALLLPAAPSAAAPNAAARSAGETFPETIPLPDGFRPEGVAVGNGSTFYTGSLGTGAVFRGDLRTGQGDLLVGPQSGRVSVGMKFDSRSGFLFVAGGPTGQAYVYDGGDGSEQAVYQLAAPNASFINDVIVTRQAAYFTNSSAAELYRLPLGPAGELPDSAQVETIPLSKDWVQVPAAFNANGIEASSNGKSLILVNSTLGALYRVDPTSGEATQIDLAGATVERGDGILLRGQTLYVVQNAFNQIAVVELSPGMESGMVVDTLTNPNFRVPTTIAPFGDALYAVNARFNVPPTPDTEYEAVRVPLTP